MKCRLFKLGLLLLTGAIVNIAVAWVCAATINPFVGQDQQTVTDWTEDGMMIEFSIATSYRFGTKLVTIYRNSTIPRDPNQPTWEVTESRGWPALSTVVHRDAFLQPTSGYVLFAQPYALRMGPGRVARALPTQFIWSGFAVNTLFYAVILWLLFFTPGALRRTIRRRRGLCPACAYPIGDSRVCTECGAAVKSKPTGATP